MDIPQGGNTCDVFLSFRGADTRGGFTSHLYAALCNAGIRTFMDHGIERGELISASLWKAINQSRHCIVVFSEHYGGSKWCLNELVKMIERRNDKNIGMGVIPIFYHVDPSHVRHQNGSFGAAFDSLLENSIHATTDRVRTWRNALFQAANLSGWRTTDGVHENELIRLVVQDISNKLDERYLFVADYPVGVECRKQNLTSKLQICDGSNDVLILGLWGMGGSGKTTIAKAVFNELGRKFNRRSFIANIREAWGYRQGKDLQEQLVNDILGETTVKIKSIDRGKYIIKERLQYMKVLVFLDDVNDQEQLKALCGNRNWFGPSSIVIITTRDVALLENLQPDYIHEMSEMDDIESLELFSWHAFRLPGPTENFSELSKDVITYCGGLPLALEVLGSYLFQKPEQLWEDVLSKLKNIPHGKVQEKLKISYDGLTDHMEKEIFLDICCFFIGEKIDYATIILNGCGLHAKIGITVLIERSLVKVDRNKKLGMHDLLRDMGREIIREKSPEELGQRSRLWFYEDALDVLKRNAGTRHVKGLALRLEESNKICLPTEAFKEMKSLRLLQLSHVELVGNYDDLLEGLRWLSWLKFPLRYPPRIFYKRRLVVVELEHSNLELFWKHPQFLHELKILNLSHSRDLKKSPNLSYLPNIERLILEGCSSLSEVDQNFGNLNNLRLINLKDCTSLRHIPSSLYRLKSLETFILSGCSKIDTLDEDIEQMESLTTLVADRTAITKVPFSIIRLKNIEYIAMCGFEGLSSDVFPSIIFSWMSPSNSTRCFSQAVGFMSFPTSSNVRSNVYAANCLESEITPSEAQISYEEGLYATNCLELEITPSKAQISYEEGSTSTNSNHEDFLSRSENFISSLIIEMGNKNILQEWTANQCDSSNLVDKHPDWQNFSYEGQRVVFKIPDVVGFILVAMILRIDYSCSQGSMASPFPFSVLIHNNTKDTILFYKRDAVSTSDDDDQWQGIVSNLEPNDEIDLNVIFGHRFSVKKTTVYLVDGDSIKKHVLSTPDRDFVVSRDEIRNEYQTLVKTNSIKGQLHDSEQEDRILRSRKTKRFCCF